MTREGFAELILRSHFKANRVGGWGHEGAGSADHGFGAAQPSIQSIRSVDQVLFSIGLTFMAVAAIDYFVGSSQQNIQLPEWLRGRTELGDGAWMLGMGHYRLFIIAVCAALTLALQDRKSVV